MDRHDLSRSLRSFAATFGSVVSAAAAVRGGRRPQARDLRRLGIDPSQFGDIGRR